MKIALLLTGNLRSFRLCNFSVNNTIVNRYDTDIFLSIDKNNMLQDANKNITEATIDSEIQMAIDLYRPCKYYICNTYSEIFKIDSSKLDINKVSSFMPVEKYQGIFEQYYIVQEAYRLLKEYIYDTGIQYNKIIRMRFDQVIWSRNHTVPSSIIYENCILYNDYSINIIKEWTKNISIDIETPQNNELYLFGWGNINGAEYTNDHFWIHSKELIEVMYKYYNELPNIINIMTSDGTRLKGGPYFEIAFNRFLQGNNIIQKKTNIIGLFSRTLINNR